MHHLVMGLIGGVLLGIAAAMLLLMNGRILGISGVLGGAMKLGSVEAGWRWAFIAGMLLAGGATYWFYPAAFADTIHRSLGACVFGGLLVGTGTQLGSGCTSGHGICGIGRGSKRSLTATMVFIAGGALSVIAVRYLFGGKI